MNKSLLELGKALSRAEQKQIKGGVDLTSVCIEEETGGKCCHYVYTHVTDEDTGIDNWVKEKVCVGGLN
ncbi:hypothetical protein [Aquimarina brevivitae]|uniref:Uncharacterized protein n=1 Tax=Aquimarina brevivitae TaxID=323412 RepID=A0A4V2F585_9FLAO|nr:hypothetical protein [Aquimarina brevivitae]RZS91939.1 hypothetical protein EV197_3043 [Aquimarina brevivitae]